MTPQDREGVPATGAPSLFPPPDLGSRLPGPGELWWTERFGPVEVVAVNVSAGRVLFVSHGVVRWSRSLTEFVPVETIP